MKLRLLAASTIALLMLSAASIVSAQGELDIISRLLQAPESTLALVALVLGVVSITVFVRVNAKNTQDADKITNRILDQYEKLAAAQQQNAAAQSNIAASIYELVTAIKKEFASVRAAQAEQTKAAQELQKAVAANALEFKAYQTLMDDAVDGLRQSVLSLVNRIGALEERVQEAAARAAEAPDKHARELQLLEGIERSLEAQRALLVEYLVTPAQERGDKDAANRVQRKREGRARQNAPAKPPEAHTASVDAGDGQPSTGARSQGASA